MVGPRTGERDLHWGNVSVRLLLMSSDPAFDYRHLSVAERLELVEQIWDSIAADADTLPLSESERQLLDERLADLEANPDAGSPWPEVRARILGKPR